MEFKIGLQYQTDKEYLKGILDALNRVKKKDRSVFYKNYRTELISKIEQLESDDNDIMKADFFMGEI